MRALPRRPRAIRAAAVAVLVVAVAAVLVLIGRPGTAEAGCGGQIRETVHPPARGVLPPYAIGDSTLILSLPQLHREGISANARGCRQYPEGLQMLATLRATSRLARVVIVALGANGQVTEANVSSALRILGTRRVLVMVTHLEPGHRAGADTALIRREPRRHPGRVIVLDWIAYGGPHHAWFQPDGLHLTFPGAAAYARFLARAIPLAAPHTGTVAH
jgi:hypothetical protein